MQPRPLRVRRGRRARPHRHLPPQGGDASQPRSQRGTSDGLGFRFKHDKAPSGRDNRGAPGVVVTPFQGFVRSGCDPHACARSSLDMGWLVPPLRGTRDKSHRPLPERRGRRARPDARCFRCNASRKVVRALSFRCGRYFPPISSSSSCMSSSSKPCSRAMNTSRSAISSEEMYLSTQSDM